MCFVLISLYLSDSFLKTEFVGYYSYDTNVTGPVEMRFYKGRYAFVAFSEYSRPGQS